MTDDPADALDAIRERLRGYQSFPSPTRMGMAELNRRAAIRDALAEDVPTLLAVIDDQAARLDRVHDGLDDIRRRATQWQSWAVAPGSLLDEMCDQAGQDMAALLAVVDDQAARLDRVHDALTHIDSGDDDAFTTLESTVEYIVSSWRRIAESESEAADRIERLTAELASVRRQRDRYQSVHDAAVALVAERRGEIGWRVNPLIEAVDAASAPDDRDGRNKHTFTVAVVMRGAGCDWSTDMEPQVVEAYDLRAALALAADRPLTAWLPEDREVTP